MKLISAFVLFRVFASIEPGCLFLAHQPLAHQPLAHLTVSGKPVTRSFDRPKCSAVRRLVTRGEDHHRLEMLTQFRHRFFQPGYGFGFASVLIHKIGARGENRTLMCCLENSGSTIELRALISPALGLVGDLLQKFGLSLLL